ncbi:hypothetical protein [Solitalea canadensis]|uniref:NfeD-like C-terminal domain-containing protein n=1 Tax=Solitalea canadensis (strain ATCC 29591 / DSM 3403 / JCM 21819 / LMG 8368 / NBRC 15130 / NCIMB 12057 / USAM 9D) TaxID=929556 RepID=H8KPX6_SOLCM|nr:hypothetical protein [Solitalea canadensis]AFD06085.1 hypothetical protein Solca_0973 [Solitalea canadensis DSM 3403]
MTFTLLSAFNGWWTSHTTIEQVLWITAVLATILLAVQALIGFGGGDHDDAFGHVEEASAADSGIDYQFITVKNLLAFFAMFGWSGLGVYSSTHNPVTSLVVALVAGLITMFLMAWIFKQMNKLQVDGTMDIKTAIGKGAEVYLKIPANRSGKGKVHVTIQSSLRELDAITDDATDINTGDMVFIKEVLASDLLIVAKHN